MTNLNNEHQRLLHLAVVVTLSFLTTAVTLAQDTTYQDGFEGAADFVITINRAGELESVKTLDEKTGTFADCELCRLEYVERYGSACENAPPELRICKGLTQATVHEFTSIDIITSHRNPDCKIIKRSGGNVVWARPQGCAH